MNTVINVPLLSARIAPVISYSNLCADILLAFGVDNNSLIILSFLNLSASDIASNILSSYQQLTSLLPSRFR